MLYIERALQNKLIEIFGVDIKRGVILAGVVGCGKTTLVNETLRQLGAKYQIFNFSGDDILFRNATSEDTTYIHKHVRSQTQGKALVFVDEVQKAESIFDAVKYAFDHSDMSFIVSGSNPDYLNTVAKKRLQRRADLLILHPFSLAEILAHMGFIKLKDADIFREIILSKDSGLLQEKIDLRLAQSDSAREKIAAIVKEYSTFGGLPLAYLAKNENEKLIEIEKVVERGFESFSINNENNSDTIKIELAKLHSQEFAYQGVFQKTGLRRRDIINKTIDQLINQGYLLKKKPYLEDENRKSYLTVFSYIDPGIVTYLTGMIGLENITGQRIEGIAHAGLDAIMRNHIPLKSSLFYYKPYAIDINNKVKFLSGEIDFVFKKGVDICAIEVKATNNLNAIKVPVLEKFVHEKGLPFGVVLYGGIPFWDKEKSKILYWPYWLI
ncbi:MAG: ATP-binding protein [Deltaproteobacteria bacterium]|nr:ATP-binding protein [Deltaproteobacteria bacterium]